MKHVSVVKIYSNYIALQYLNHPNTTCDWSKNICVSKLQRNYRKAEVSEDEVIFILKQF